MKVVLVVDRDGTLASSLKDTLEAKGLKVEECLEFASECEIGKLLGSLEAKTACITSCRVQSCALVKGIDLVAAVINLSLLALDGWSVVRRLKQLWPDAAIVTMVEPRDSALIQHSIEIIQQGAADFLVKPVSEQYVVNVIDRARKGVLPSLSTEQTVKSVADQALIGKCDAMKSVFAQILQIGRTEKVCGRARPVLIIGETGTGKQLVARALHQTGLRPQGPFVEINCAAIPTPLLEAELFGYEKGAFTDAKAAKAGLFEQADGGMLFLDEICSMDLAMQSKILKAIEDQCIRRIGGLHGKNVNVRVVAASNQTSMAELGRFLRRDLYYRLSSFLVALPPLRDRGEDIPTLAQFFLNRIVKQWGRPEKCFTPEAEHLLLSHAWPGNVRELMHVIERVATQHMGETISALDLHLVMPDRPSSVSISSDGDVTVDFGSNGINLEDVERKIIIKALSQAQWNRGQAARLLGITKETLRYRIEKFRLSQGAPIAAALVPRTPSPTDFWPLTTTVQ